MAPSPGTPIRILALLLPVFGLAQASCRPGITEQGKRELRSAAGTINQGSYSDAADQLEEFIEAYPRSDEVAEARYLIGLCLIHTGRPDQAQQQFRLALPLADVPVLEQYVRLSLANLAFENREYTTAGEFYGTYLDNLPPRPPFHLAYYRYGLALQATGQWKLADLQFARIFQVFPQVDIIPAVRQHFGQTHYAIELGRFGSFDLAQRQRERLPDWASELHWQLERAPDAWKYVNYYGKFSDYRRAQEALGKIKPHLSQARIVP